MTSMTIDFSSPAVQADPYPIYAELRRDEPVFWNGNAWLISRYDDVVSLLTDPRSSSRRVDATFAVLPPEVQAELQPLRDVLNARMLLSDPPDHTRLRTLVTKTFSARAAHGRRERIQEHVDRLLGTVVARGEMDAMTDFATPLPSFTIADVLGVPATDEPMFTRWARDQVRIYDRLGTAHERIEVMRQGQVSMFEMKMYLEAIIEQRRNEPQDDLITLLVQAEEEGDRLTVDEMVVMVIAVLVGGNNSTAHLLGNAIATLARYPEQRERIKANPELTRTAVEEVLRFESPVQTTSRVAKEDIEIGGQLIPTGADINVLLASANRDDAHFPEPDVFDVARQPNRHLDFAHGPHFCLGSALARNVAQVAVLSIIERLDNLSLVNDTVEWAPGFAFRHPKSLPVTCTAS